MPLLSAAGGGIAWGINLPRLRADKGRNRSDRQRYSVFESSHTSPSDEASWILAASMGEDVMSVVTLWILVVWSYNGHLNYIASFGGPFKTKSACEQVLAQVKELGGVLKDLRCLKYEDLP